MINLPRHWFSEPLYKTIKKQIRLATALTRRKELVMKMAMPREIFEDFLSGLGENGAEGLVRDPVTQKLVPTTTTAKLFTYKYVIRRGSVNDKLFRLQALRGPPPPTLPRRSGLGPSAAADWRGGLPRGRVDSSEEDRRPESPASTCSSDRAGGSR